VLGPVQHADAVRADSETRQRQHGHGANPKTVRVQPIGDADRHGQTRGGTAGHAERQPPSWSDGVVKGVVRWTAPANARLTLSGLTVGNHVGIVAYSGDLD